MQFFCRITDLLSSRTLGGNASVASLTKAVVYTEGRTPMVSQNDDSTVQISLEKPTSMNFCAFYILMYFSDFSRCGDVILSVNNYHLSDIAHSHAVSLLKHVKGTVALNIVSWPGTVV